MSIRACSLLALVLALAGCGPSEPPCTGDKCPKVGGTYLVDAPSVDASQSSCKAFEWRGGSGLATLEQQDSVLTLKNFLATITGTLFATGAATFRDTHVNSSESKDSFTMSMIGTFTGPEGAKVLKGTMVFLKKEGNCNIHVPVTLTQQSAQ